MISTNGDVVVGGAETATVFFNGEGSLTTGVLALPIDFEATSAYLATLSLFWGLLIPTGTVSFSLGTTTLTCVNSNPVQVFSMPGSNFNSFGSYTIEFSGCTASQTIIIDVTGVDVAVSYQSLFTIYFIVFLLYLILQDNQWPNQLWNCSSLARCFQLP